MKVSFLILTFLLILADDIFAKRLDDDNNGYRNIRKRGDRDANVNIEVEGRRNPNLTDVYRCTTNMDNTDGFVCSIPNNIKCDPDEDRCFKQKGPNSKCALYPCSNSKNGVPTIEDLRKKGFEESHIIPYVCVPPNFNHDKKDSQCVHQSCHEGTDYLKKGSCSGKFECKIVSCVAKHAAKNNLLSGLSSPGLFHGDQIKGGHNHVTFPPWKCVPKDMDQPLIGGKYVCDKHEFCYDKKEDPMRAGNKCQPGFKCVLEENCPYVIMYKGFDKELYGASSRGNWTVGSKHGTSGNYFEGIHDAPTFKPTKGPN